MKLKTDEIAWGMKDMFKIKQQANNIIAQILISLSNSAYIAERLQTLIWIIVSISYVEKNLQQ